MLWDLLIQQILLRPGSLALFGLRGYVVDKTGTVSILHSPEVLLRIQVIVINPDLSVAGPVSVSSLIPASQQL